MKKMLFSAIAMIALAGSAFASNEVVVEKEIDDTKMEIDNQTDFFYVSCTVEIWGYNSAGKYILLRTYQVRSYPYSTCAEAVTAINKVLNP